MKLSVFTILLVSITASLHGALGAEQCGIQAGGALCPNGLCCSRWGFCGITGPFCDPELGCQSQCIHPPVCGNQAGGALCPDGLCCSGAGYCGNTNAYCGAGCQSQCSNPPVCGIQAGGALCPDGQCCSGVGYCGNTNAYCGADCQSQCSRPSQLLRSLLPLSLPSPGADGVASIISSALFDELLKHRNNTACPARGFYRYEDFIAAADAFVGFGTTGDLDTRKREIAAFLAQTSHQTTGARPSPQDGPYAWGYCFLEQVGATADYCVPSMQWPCAPGKKFFGRGPIQIS